MDLSLAKRQISPSSEATCDLLHQETTVPESNESMDIPIAFTKFPELPTEIRLRIWNFMLPSSRIVHLRFEEPGRIHFNPSLPITLQVNHESRLESLTQLMRSGTSPLGESPPHYFFSTLDIVSIDRHSLGSIAFSFFFWHVQNRLGEDALCQIKQLAIEDTVWNNINSRNAKPPHWEDLILRLDKFIVFSKENPDEDAMTDLEFSEPLTRDSALRLEEQVTSMVESLLPSTSSSSSSERKIPEIRALGCRRKPTTPVLSPELQVLEDTMEHLSIG